MLVNCLRLSSRPFNLSYRGGIATRLISKRTISSASALPHSQVSRASSLSALLTDLDRLAPRIDIQPDQVEIIHTPRDFYEALISRIRKARRRIFLSTLYIGKSEHDLISAIRQTLQHRPELTVSILTDALRGTRESPEPSCASLLVALVAEFPDRVDIRMYHTPNLTGLRKALIPRRINEGWGLQHMKLYGIDNEIILSGANLSRDYFTDRQDRYHLFKSKRVTDFFAGIHDAVCTLSFKILPGPQPDAFELVWPPDNPAPNPLKSPKKYIKSATTLLEPYANPPLKSAPRATTSTSLYPLLVHPPTVNNELAVFTSIFKQPMKSYTFTAGYFNPHPAITSSLLSASSDPTNASGTVLTASPYANGFYGSKGVSGMLPPAYTHLASLFLRAARGKAIQLREWQNGIVNQPGGWTYHAKGLWITLPQSSPSSSSSSSSSSTGDQSPLDKDKIPEISPSTGPSATLIGSSNYTTRSYGLDLEVGALLVTSDEKLMKKWKDEEEDLLKHTKKVSEADLAADDRRATLKVRIAMWIVKLVGGAL